MDRRSFIAGALAAPTVLAAPHTVAAQEPPRPDLYGDGSPFSREALEAHAQDIARRPFQAPAQMLPDGFADLPRDVYQTIRMRPDRMLWAGDARGFSLDLLPGGAIYRSPVRIGLVEDGKVRMVANDPSWFDFGRAPTPPADRPISFSGVSVRWPIEPGKPAREMFTLQGGTIFRALAREQIFGTSSRGLAIDTAEPNGEEFPVFRALWIERPGGDALVLHALLDSRRVAGVYRLTLRPGDISVVDVEMTLFPRENLGHVGIAPMTSMFFFGPNDRAGIDDVRGQVHRADGLQIWNGGSEWVWRPLVNPSELQISVFTDNNPKGFGLQQRQRGFAAYNDLGRRYDKMPSVWIEPIGDWGEGQFQLLEIPSDTDINENIVAYWRPKAPVAAGSRVAWAYRQHWCWTPPDRPGGATTVGVATGAAGGRRRRFIVDFAGERVADPERAGAIRPMVTTSAGTIRNIQGRHNPEIKGYRVMFDLDPGDEDLCELRMVLEADGPISETWLYRWTP